MRRKAALLVLTALLLALLVLPVQAQEMQWVNDSAEVLTKSQLQELENLCAETSEAYNCGVYVITVEDYTYCGSGSIYDVSQEIYRDCGLGLGEDQAGIMLLLSIQDRELGLYTEGEFALYAFDDYGLQMLEEEFLPYLEENDWYGGMRAYVLNCNEYLEKAEAGEPVRKGDLGAILIAVAVSFLVSLVVCLILRAGMKNVRTNTEAGIYADPLDLTRKVDLFTHITRTRVKIKTDSEKFVAHSGGGGRGRSGKF